MDRGLRLVFTGHARVGQRRITNLLALYLAKERGIIKETLPTSTEEIEARAAQADIRELVLAGRDMCVESVLSQGGREMEVFLDAGDHRRQVQEWRDAFKKILERATVNPQKHIFVSLHSVYYRRTRFLSLVDFDLIQQLEPDLFITITDDVQSVWHRIQKRSQTAAAKSHFGMSEILAWRTAELLFSDTLAAQTVKSEYALNHRMKNYLLAAKHPVEMLYRLAFELDKLRVYASFPISAVRRASSESMEAHRDPINDFRARLHSVYTVFDPVTIDEKIIEFAQPHDGGITLPKPGLPEAASRWALGFEHPLVPDDTDCYPLKVPEEDVAEAARKNPDTGRAAIDDHIRFRDYRLIDQADCVAAFRPNYEGQPSVGMSDELRHAQFTMVPAYGYNPPQDHTGNPFGDLLTTNCQSLDELLEVLDRHQKRKKEGG